MLMTHCAPEAPIPRSRRMSGSAMTAVLTLRTSTNCETHSTPRPAAPSAAAERGLERPDWARGGATLGSFPPRRSQVVRVERRDVHDAPCPQARQVPLEEGPRPALAGAVAAAPARLRAAPPRPDRPRPGGRRRLPRLPALRGLGGGRGRAGHRRRADLGDRARRVGHAGGAGRRWRAARHAPRAARRGAALPRGRAVPARRLLPLPPGGAAGGWGGGARGRAPAR